MTRALCKGSCGLVWFACGLALTGVVGCSEPGEGTATVATEARQRLLPQAGPKAIGAKASAAGKKLSIKDRSPTAPASPDQ